MEQVFCVCVHVKEKKKDKQKGKTLGYVVVPLSLS